MCKLQGDRCCVSGSCCHRDIDRTVLCRDNVWMIFLTISYLHENTWTGEILNLPDCNKKCTVICKNWIVWFSLNLQFRVIKTNATIPYHKFKFNNCEKKEVNLRSLYFTYFPNYVCNLQYDTNKKLYKSAISHPIGLVEVKPRIT